MDNETLKNLREDLIGEIGAINQYQEHIDETNNEEVKKILGHIRDDEKEHFAELTKIEVECHMKCHLANNHYGLAADYEKGEILLKLWL